MTTEAIQRLFAISSRAGKTVIVVTHEDVSHSDYSRIISLHTRLARWWRQKEQRVSSASCTGGTVMNIN